MNNDLISRSALKKTVENLVAGGAERLKDYYENGSKSEENEWIGGVYDVWNLIVNASPIETTIENLISTLSVEALKATTWFKVDTPSGESVCFRREKTGHWIDEGQYAEGHSEHYYRCSECGGHIINLRVDDFCKHCGADMRGGVKND